MSERSAIEVMQQRSADLMQQRSADLMQQRSVKARIKISVNTDISVIGFYGYIGNIGKYRWIFLQKYRKI